MFWFGVGWWFKAASQSRCRRKHARGLVLLFAQLWPDMYSTGPPSEANEDKISRRLDLRWWRAPVRSYLMRGAAYSSSAWPSAVSRWPHACASPQRSPLAETGAGHRRLEQGTDGRRGGRAPQAALG